MVWIYFETIWATLMLILSNSHTLPVTLMETNTHPHSISLGEFRTRRPTNSEMGEAYSFVPRAVPHPYLSPLHHISILRRGVPPTHCWHIKGLRQIRPPPPSPTAMSQLFRGWPARRRERPGMTKERGSPVKKWILHFPLGWVEVSASACG